MDTAVEIALPRRAAPPGPEASHLDELLDRHESRLRRVAYGMLGDPHTVEDVLQDALIKVFRHLPRRFESGAEESAWLYQIV
jgi:DNA-directed RNA polymerase specialized sigma24 family protein